MWGVTDTLLAAAADQNAPVLASVLALLAFLIGIAVVVHDSPSGRIKDPRPVVPDDVPEDQVGR